MSSVAPDTTSAVAPAAPVSAPQVIDVEALLVPISSEKPSGENLQYSPLYDEIKEARRSDDNLAKGDWEHEPKTAEWSTVVELSTSTLSSQTKDLQIGAWLTEAIVELHGFVGLRDGLRLMRGLHERFWDTLYPEVDGEDLEARANALAWLDSKLETPLKNVALTNSGSGLDFSYIQWEESVKFDIPTNLDGLDSDAFTRMSELKAQAEAEGKTTSEAWRKAKDSSRRAFYESTYLVLKECWDEFQLLDRVMDERFGRQTPGLGALKKALDSLRTLAEKLVKEKRILEPDPVADANGSAASDASSDGEGGMPGVAGPLRSRAEALRRLAEVAQYFQRTEPHSPVAYLVERAIKWGQMPLEVWLEDVIKDGNVLGQLKETLGLETPVVSSEEQS
jgi:type VI secretion system protein ImpA